MSRASLAWGGVALVGLFALGLVGGAAAASPWASPAHTIDPCAIPSLSVFYGPMNVPVGTPYTIHAVLYYPALTIGNTAAACLQPALFHYSGQLVPQGNLTTPSPIVFVANGASAPGVYTTTVVAMFGTNHLGYPAELVLGTGMLVVVP